MRTLKNLLILLVIVILLCACQPIEAAAVQAAVQATPQPAATQAPTAAPRTAVPERQPLWTFEAGGEVWSSPLVNDGVVYFGSDDHNLYAVDTQTHQALWTFVTGGFVRSRPAIEDGLIFTTSEDNFLYALDAATGKQVWKLELGTPISGRGDMGTSWDYLQTSPVVSKGVVFAGDSSGTLFAVDAKTGTEKWRYKTKFVKIRSTPAIADGMLYVGAFDGSIYALDEETGKLVWSFDTEGYVTSSPLVVNGVVYCGSRSTFIYALDAKSGEELWRFGMGQSWVESTTIFVDGTLYVGSSDSLRLYAIDATTGKEQWHFATNAYSWSTPAYADGVAYIGTYGGVFYAVDTQTHEARWKLDISADRYGKIVSSAMIDNGVIYFGGTNHKLYAMSIEP